MKTIEIDDLTLQRLRAEMEVYKCDACKRPETMAIIAQQLGFYTLYIDWWNATLDYLDRYYPDWRGYRVELFQSSKKAA